MNFIGRTIACVEGERFRLIHGTGKSLVEFFGFLRRGKFVASSVVDKFILGATLPDAGISVAEFRRSANARYQLTIRRGIRRHLEAGIVPIDR
jgi:hypothetical protein